MDVKCVATHCLVKVINLIVDRVSSAIILLAIL